MIQSRYIHVIIAVILIIAVAFTFVYMLCPQWLGIVPSYAVPEYQSKLFDKNKVMTIDIIVDEEEWNEMLENAMQEEYISCDLSINGEVFQSVGVRPKGNSSLSMVASSDSDRYSFKFEFDQYVKGQTCYGLDKFVVNNMQSDATYMKEYFSYELMEHMGIPTPLYAFANITVNGEDWGFYLAIEALEESFAQRQFGSDYGMLYKPDSMDMGGGRGFEPREDGQQNGMQPPQMPDQVQGQQPNQPQDGQENLENQEGRSAFPALPDGEMPGQSNRTPTGEAGGITDEVKDAVAQEGLAETGDRFGNHLPADMGRDNNRGGFPGGGSGGGSDLVYTDDSVDSYSSIFDKAVFEYKESDARRVITALQHLNEGTDLEKYIDVDEVLRYFAVNTFLVNLDSYAGSMKHNYYLYEKDGQLSILPWDFNLSFAGFQSGSASAAVNFPIDTPVSGTTLEDRPLIGKLLEVPEYLERYHSYLQEIVDYVNNGTFETRVLQIDQLIQSYVNNDATAFYTYEEYAAAVPMLLEYVKLRTKSIEGQLDGAIPSTDEGQSQEPDKLIDSSTVNLTTMGSQGGGGGPMGGGRMNVQADNTEGNTEADAMPEENRNKNMQGKQRDMRQDNWQSPENDAGQQAPAFPTDSESAGNAAIDGNGERNNMPPQTRAVPAFAVQQNDTSKQVTFDTFKPYLVYFILLIISLAFAILIKRRRYQ